MKIQVGIEWTKWLMGVHPVVFITTVGEVGGLWINGCAPFATCLDTSYDPPMVTFAMCVHQHSIAGQSKRVGRMNTDLNLEKVPYFVVNIPSVKMLSCLDILSYPYERDQYQDKIALAGLTVLPSDWPPPAPPLVVECLANIECEVVDKHLPPGSDHWLVTGRVVRVSFDSSLGTAEDPDCVRQNLVRQVFHHFGSSVTEPGKRGISLCGVSWVPSHTFLLEHSK